MTNGPKSAFELAMERLRQADREAGVEDVPLTDEQKERIAEARKVASARLAEREILYRDARRKANDPALLSQLEDEYRIDRERIESDRDRQIERIRKGSA